MKTNSEQTIAVCRFCPDRAEVFAILHKKTRDPDPKKRPESASAPSLLRPLKKQTLVRLEPTDRLFSVLYEKRIGSGKMPASDKGNRGAPCRKRRRVIGL